MGIKGEGAQSGIGTARWVGDAFDDGLQNPLDAYAGLRAGEDRLLGWDGKDVLQLALGILDIGIRKIDFVDDGNELESLLLGEVHIGNRLRLHTLGGVDDQQGAFAGCKRAGDFVGKIHMARSVGEIQLIMLTILSSVFHRDGMGLDRDAALALKIHGVEHLLLGLALLDRSCDLQKAIGKSRLTVVDVGDDAKVARVFYSHEKAGSIGHSERRVNLKLLLRRK